MRSRFRYFGLERFAPAHFLAIFASGFVVAPLDGASAQPARAQAPSPAQGGVAVPVPDRIALAKLILSTITAVDHANKTGNYSVLLDLGTRGFAQTNSPASLSVTFASIREGRIDLSDVLMLSPAYDFEPTMIDSRTLRARGRFALRPRTIGFDLLYQWENGWRLHGIALAVLS